MFSFVNNSEENSIIFYGSGGVSSGDDWSIWTKPAGIKFIRIFCLAGGGGGARRTTGSSGGGGSGAVMVVTYPSIILPETLFVQAGRAGLGATSSGDNGGNGGNSFVCTYPNTTVEIYRLAYCDGGLGSLASGTAGGLLGGTTSVSDAPLITNGIYSVRGGITGATGGTAGTNAAGINIAITTGGGGGGTTGKGGDINVSEANPLIAGTPSGASTQGEHGIFQWKTLRSVGGAGGNDTGPGGHGAYGSGGGGSGATRNGGDGGAGLVIISCW
jgi:hypothetical protein